MRPAGRRSIRLAARDYAEPGAYFVTICTHDRRESLGHLVDGVVRLGKAGLIVEACWRQLPTHFPHVTLDELVVMPDHLHGILVLGPITAKDGCVPKPSAPSVGARHASPLHPLGRAAGTARAPRPLGRAIRTDRAPHPPGASRGALGAIVGSFKSAATRRINALHGTPGAAVWQRGYYEHVVRAEEWDRVRDYIATNPLRRQLANEGQWPCWGEACLAPTPAGQGRRHGSRAAPAEQARRP